MTSTIKLMTLIVLASVVCATPVVEDGDFERFAKFRSFSSEESDIDGDIREDSEMSDEAFVNDEPLYFVNGERHFDPEEGEHMSLDMINPEENNHIHLDNLNGESIEFAEPLDEVPDYMIDDLEQRRIDEDLDDVIENLKYIQQDEPNEDDFDY